VLAGLRTRWLGVPAAALALATVVATAMIYAQMKSVPRWRSPVTPVLFLLFALAGGALLAGAARPAPWLRAGLGLAQGAAWIHGDRRLAGSGTTLATATGLGAFGRLRLLEPPHTGRNYLLREMVHVVGRRHAVKLRLAGLVLAVLLPLALVLLQPSPPVVALAAIAHVLGALVLRWLFFAEAEHVVGLYYGRR
jgi:DMSO reductase anchor subunit